MTTIEEKVRELEEDSSIDVFTQAQGRSKIVVVKIAPTATVRSLLDAAAEQGLPLAQGDAPTAVSLEESEEPVRLDARLDEIGIIHRSRIHIHRCRHVDVKVFFNGRTIDREFSPAATIRKVTEWAVGKEGFNLDPTDALEHALQVSGITERPDEDEHLGTVVRAPACGVSFELAPKHRVEG